MKVNELTERLRELPQDAEVCYCGHDGGLYEIADVKTATNNYDELKEFVGDEFVIIE